MAVLTSSDINISNLFSDNADTSTRLDSALSSSSPFTSISFISDMVAEKSEKGGKGEVSRSRKAL